MTWTLYGYEGNPRTRIVLITAAAADIGELELSIVNPRQGINVDEYKAKFPLANGKIPALGSDRGNLTEVLAISWLIASCGSSNLIAQDQRLKTEAELLSWCSWANSELQPTLSRWILPLIPGWKYPPPYSYDAVEEGKKRSLQLLDILENALRPKQEYLIKWDLTIADIFVATFLARAFEWVLDAEWREMHPKIWAYYQHKLELECFKKVIGDVVAIEKETPNVNPYA